MTAANILDQCLADIDADDRQLVAITRVLRDRAKDEAAAVDAAVAAGIDPGPLAGVPYGVKDLFSVAGLPTTAGSALYANVTPATADAEAIRRLRGAGAVLVATLNMDEFAYGFATINAHHGTTRNPYDLTRLAGGSSGGSAAAVSAGLLPFSLGSDTNGSVRVPASLTGIYGFRPTHGALPMAGVFPLAQSFDDIGPFARSIAELRVIWQVLGGMTDRSEPATLRIGGLGGRFRDNADPAQLAAINAIAPDAPMVDLPDVMRARSAAFLITAAEGAAVHHAALARDPMAFDPATRDRLLAGALLPPALVVEAQAFRTRFNDEIDRLLAAYNVLLAPAAPCVAPRIDDPYVHIDGEWTPARRDLGIHTQPISFTGRPVLAVPLLRPDKLPLGLQLIGRHGGESKLFDFAAMLEAQGWIGFSPPTGPLQRDERC